MEKENNNQNIVPNDKIESKKNANVPNLRFKHFSKDWNKFLIEELFDFKNGLNKEKEAFGKGTPIINYMDVNKNRYLYFHNINGKVLLNTNEINMFTVKYGDVFFTRTSETSDEIGLSSVWLGGEHEDIVFSGFLLRARPKSDKIVPIFCSYLFSNNRIRSEIISKSSITTRALTSGKLLNKVVNYYPNDKQEQIKIANLFFKLDKRIETQNKIIKDELSF